MFAHRLNRYIIIYVSTNTKNALGTPKETETELKRTWAEVQYPAGRMEDREYGEISRTDAIFIVRYDSRINYKCRIYFNNQFYRINHIEQIGREEGLRIRTVMFIDEEI